MFASTPRRIFSVWPCVCRRTADLHSKPGRLSLRSCGLALQLLREECGVNVLESVRKTKAQRSALESLCRKLQEDNKRLAAQAPAELADGSDQPAEEEESESEVLHVDVACIQPCKQLDADADAMPAVVH